jgi:hypothetical protein
MIERRRVNSSRGGRGKRSAGLARSAEPRQGMFGIDVCYEQILTLIQSVHSTTTGHGDFPGDIGCHTMNHKQERKYACSPSFVPFLLEAGEIGFVVSHQSLYVQTWFAVFVYAVPNLQSHGFSGAKTNKIVHSPLHRNHSQS